MSNQLSNQLLAQLFAQGSGDPFLTLVTLSHASFSAPIRLVNNSVNIISRGDTYLAFPMKIKLPMDDGESAREVSIEFDNVSQYLLDGFRSVTTEIGVKIEMILASLPNDVQMSLEELKISSVSYSATRVSAKLMMDSFLHTEMTSEKYGPSNFRGLF